jgi:hypothetical protein
MGKENDAVRDIEVQPEKGILELTPVLYGIMRD